jgi:redox-sensitive bicupin YhaK (pirin superfamily)
VTQLIRSSERYHKDAGWLQANWHFAFADYHDPDNVQFGPLRVFNDDVVQPGTGFDLHPHKDMEIITYVISGQLEHQDHLGNRGLVHAGEVQVMSAGKGIMHGERNPSKTEPVRLLQIWVMPRTKGGQPRWEQKQFTPQDRWGKLLPVVSPSDAPSNGTLTIDQDATVYVSSLKPGESVEHETKPGRLTYLFVITGKAEAEGGDVTLAGGDQLRIADPIDLKLTATEATELMLIDLPEA